MNRPACERVLRSRSVLLEAALRSFWPAALVLVLYVLLALVLQVTRDCPGSDMAFHLAGGFAIAWGAARGIGILQRAGLARPIDPIVRHLLVFGLTAAAAVFWEFFEFTVDHLIGTRLQMDLTNTMSDLALGLAGGCVSILLDIVCRRDS